MKLLQQFALLLSLVLLFGCSPDPIRISTPLDEAKAKRLLTEGKNTIYGQIRKEVRDGVLVSCANEPVNLVPVTDYAREWVRYYYETDSGKYGTERSAYRVNDKEKKTKFAGAERFYHLTKETKCNDDGEYSFENVHDGDFYVVVKVRWLGKNHEYYDFMWGTSTAQEHDGSVLTKVSLQDGVTKNLSWSFGGAEILDGEALSTDQ